jgi:acyl-CoA dehydrogenase
MAEPMLQTDTRTVYDADLNLFRDQVRKFYARALIPHLDRWEEEGVVDRGFWLAAGEAGLLCPQVPPEYGGLGLDYRYNAVIGEELSYAGSSAGITLQSDIVVDYIINYGSEEQKQRWLPGMVSGEVISAIAMTEPGAGSDLQGVRTTAKLDGDHYVINGQKTFITNGQTANLICVVCKTDPTQGSRGTSLIFVETDGAEGFRRGRNLDKVGQDAGDTSELFFDDVRVPTTNLLSDAEGQGFYQLMQKLPQERQIIALQGLAMIEHALEVTIDYVKQRQAFGKKIIDFQNTQFVMAECKSEATVAKVFLEIGRAHV